MNAGSGASGGRALVVSKRWVPAGGGSAIVLYELFRHFPPGTVDVLCGPGLRPPTSMTLPFPTSRLTVPAVDRWVSGGLRLMGRSALPLVRRAIELAVRRLKPCAIYAHFPDAVFVTAAALTAEKFGIPLVTYFDILWEGNVDPVLAREYEHRVVRIAQRRFAITETFCEHLSKKHGVSFELLPHVIVPPDPQPEPLGSSERRNVIHFGGAVYEDMNLDSMQRMHRVLARQPEPPTFEILGFTPRADLERWGFDGPFVQMGSVPREELLSRQRKSRVLYLPEAFKSGAPEMIRHNFPTKALEYAVSGTPILVHAPPESYLSRTARENGWAVVVDKPDDDALRGGLRRVTDGGPEIDAMVDRAWEFARSRDGRVWSRVLQGAIGVT